MLTYAQVVCIEPVSGELAALGSAEIKITVDPPLDSNGRFVTCEGPSCMVLVVRDLRLANEPEPVAQAGIKKVRRLLTYADVC